MVADVCNHNNSGVPVPKRSGSGTPICPLGSPRRMRQEVSRVRRGLLALLKVEWLGRPDCRRGLVRPLLVPGQNPGSETRQKLVILRGLSSSIHDCSKGMIVESPAPPFTCGGLSDRRERRRRQVKRLVGRKGATFTRHGRPQLQPPERCSQDVAQGGWPRS